MVNISKNGETILIEVDGKKTYFPSAAVIAHADKDSDSVDIKLKASRKTVMSFNYKDINPTQTSAYEAVRYIASLL